MHLGGWCVIMKEPTCKVQEGVFHTKIDWKKWLPVLLVIVGVICLVGAILLFAIAAPRADQTYKRVFSIICGILMLILAGLCGLYYWFSKDVYQNYFLFDRKRGKNIPLENLKFSTVSERLSFLLTELADTPEQLWLSDVLLHEDDMFGYRSVYKPLAAYKMLYNLAELSEDSGYWKAFRSAPESNINAFCEALQRAGETQMVEAFRSLIERNPVDNAKIKEFLCKNLRYLRNKMMVYIKKHIELFY